MGIAYNSRKREIVVTGVEPDEWKRFPAIKALPGSLEPHGFVISLRCANQVFQLRDIVMVQPARWSLGKPMTTRHIFKARGFSMFEVKQGASLGYTLSGNVVSEESE